MMLEKTTRHLLKLNSLVFVALLSLFSCADYLAIAHNADSESRHELMLITDTIVSSIEPPDENESDDAVPDVVQSDKLKDSGRVDLTLQWFDKNEHLLAKKGSLPITLPFLKSANFEIQQKPHALVLTRAVDREGQLIGYLRVAQSLAELDRFKQNVLVGLAVGTAITILAGGIAIVWLVRQALKPVEISIRKLAEFIGDASHELKGPIMAIQTNGAVALKYSEGLSDTHRKNIEMMLDAAEQMGGTIADLLSLAEAEHEPNEATADSFSLSVVDLFNELTEELNHLCSAKDLKFLCLVDNPNLFIRVRKADIKLVLHNVVKNAITYSNAGESVTIRGSKIGNKVQFEIRDTGIGISEDDLPRIFDRFWRSDKARSYTSGGNGLGLAIVKTIVDRYKGEITVKSKLGSGTVVRIGFPNAAGFQNYTNGT